MTGPPERVSLSSTTVIEARRRKRRWGGLIAAIGLGLIVFEIIYSRYVAHVTPSWVAILVGAGVGFVGFYILDPNGAHEGGDLLVGYGVKILGAVRNGRRATDNLVAVAEPAGVVVAENVTARVEIPAVPRPSGGDLFTDDERGEHTERAP